MNRPPSGVARKIRGGIALHRDDVSYEIDRRIIGKHYECISQPFCLQSLISRQLKLRTAWEVLVLSNDCAGCCVINNYSRGFIA